MQLERIGTLEERIEAEIEELAKRTIEMENDIEMYKDPERQQLHSADAAKGNQQNEYGDIKMECIQLITRLNERLVSA